MLWKSLGLRWATITERAIYNLLATLLQDIMPRERLREKAGKISVDQQNSSKRPLTTVSNLRISAGE